MTTMRNQVYQILDGDPLTAPPFAKIVNAIIVFAIILSVAMVIIESHQPTYAAYEAIFITFERVSIAFFSAEYLLRLWARGDACKADNGGPRRGRLEYVTSFHGVIDLISIAPFYLQMFIPGLDLRILRLFRLMRLLKISRYNSALDDLARAIKSERNSFIASLYIIFIVTILSSALMYYAEGDAQPEKLASIPHAIYWSLITLTTVGYGDISPVTTFGKIISSVTALLGVATVAMFTGIIASAFSKQVERRRMIYQQELEKAYEDGVLSRDEDALLTELKKRFDLSEEDVESIKKRALKS